MYNKITANDREMQKKRRWVPRLDEGFSVNVRRILRRRIADSRKVKGLEAMKPGRSKNGIFGLKWMEKTGRAPTRLSINVIQASEIKKLKDAETCG